MKPVNAWTRIGIAKMNCTHCNRMGIIDLTPLLKNN